MLECHNSTEGCACGLDPSPLCAPCQADLEKGAWYNREGDAYVLGLKTEVADLGSRISKALTATTWEECRAALGAKEASRMAG